MTKQEIEQVAREYAESLSDSIYDHHAKLCFIAGAEFVLKRTEKLVEALERMADNHHAGKFQADAQMALKEWRGE